MLPAAAAPARYCAIESSSWYGVANGSGIDTYIYITVMCMLHGILFYCVYYTPIEDTGDSSGMFYSVFMTTSSVFGDGGGVAGGVAVESESLFGAVVVSLSGSTFLCVTRRPRLLNSTT